MSNVQLKVQAASTTYAVSLEQMQQLIAENLDVPPECIAVRYKLANSNYDGPGYSSQHVTGIEVTVDNEAIARIKQTARHAR